MHMQSEVEATALSQQKSQPKSQPELQHELIAPLQPEPIPRVLPVSDLRRQEVTVSEQEKQEKQVEEKKETPAKEVLIQADTGGVYGLIKRACFVKIKRKHFRKQRRE